MKKMMLLLFLIPMFLLQAIQSSHFLRVLNEEMAQNGREILSLHQNALDDDISRIANSISSYWALDYSHSKLLYHQSDFNAYQYSYNVLKEYRSLMSLEPSIGALLLISQANHMVLGAYNDSMISYASLPQMLQFVDFVTEYVENSASKGKCQGRSQIERILSYIQKNLTRNISRSEISKALYLNPEYLSRLFKREMGIGLAEYLIQERMRLAQSLLKNTSFSISIIASRVGYVNFSHFAKVFKQEFGVSPSEYRKMCDPQGK